MQQDESTNTEKQKNSRLGFTARKPNMDKLKAYKKTPSKRTQAATGLIIACLLFGLVGGWFGAAVYEHNHHSDGTVASRQQIVSSESQLISGIAKNVGQSVVSVDVQTQTTAQDFFGVFQPLTQQSSGTGFIISSDGVIVTNRHVVPAGTNSVTVTLADGTRYTGVQVIGRTTETSPLDVAFLKITDTKGKKLEPVKVGDSSTMQVGDRVVAIGNALGQFQNTVTSGIISGYGRDVQAGSQGGSSIESLTDLFQTDAAINEGNSGGPLVNVNGEVIGLNTAVASGAQNIGFSIPVNDFKGLINSVLANGKLQLPYLGVRYVSLTADIAYQYNLKVDKGAYIVPSTDGSPSVVPGSPAEKAGLMEKDIITKVKNINIDNRTSLTSALSRFKVGDRVTLTVIRDGKTITVPVTLEATPAA
jgi:S1-C subfamily serine protease